MMIEASYKDDKGKRWVLIHPMAVSVPQYIEGNARGTIKHIDGHLYRQVDEEPVERLPRLPDWCD